MKTADIVILYNLCWFKTNHTYFILYWNPCFSRMSQSCKNWWKWAFEFRPWSMDIFIPRDNNFPSSSSKIHIFLYIHPKQIISNFIRIFFRCIFDRLHFLKVCFNSLWICLNHKKIKIFHFYVYAIYNQLFLAKYCIMN